MASRTGEYWYSLIAAAPNPEAEEVVNVAIVLGNGRLLRIEYQPKLPRLAGLVAADEAKVYEAVLEHAARTLDGQVSLEDLQARMGPQLRVMRRRALLRAPDDALLERLRDQYLSTPRLPYRDDARRLAQMANAQLDSVIERVRPKRVIVQKKVTPRHLYEGRLERFVPFTVPQIARALRSDTRDLLVDSVIVDAEHLKTAISRTAPRIGRAFHAYGKLAPIIRQTERKELRRVGVIHPGTPDDSPDVVEARDWVRRVLALDADDVIDGNQVDVEEALAEESAWVAAGARG